MRLQKVHEKLSFLTLLLFALLLTACGGGGTNTGNNGKAQIASMASAIVGTWDSACIIDNSGFHILTYGFASDGSFYSADTFYTDNGCTTKTGVAAATVGTYSLGNLVLASSGVAAVRIDETNMGNTIPNGKDIVYIDASDQLYLGNPLTQVTTRPSDLDYSYPFTREVVSSPILPTGMLGSWHTECLYVGADPATSNSLFAFFQLSFDNSGAYSLKAYTFSEPTCSIKSNLIQQSGDQGTYSANSPITTPSNRNAIPLDITVTSTTSTTTTTPYTAYALVSSDNSALWFTRNSNGYPSDFNASEPFNYFNSGSVPTPGVCLAYDIPGEPDILDNVTMNTNSVSAGTSVTVTVPVDADTGYISVSLLDINNGTYGGSNTQTITAGSAQSVKVVVPTTSATAGDLYAPYIYVCTDIDACHVSGTGSGIGVSYTPIANFESRLNRGKFYDNGTISTRVDHSTCIANPILTVK